MGNCSGKSVGGVGQHTTCLHTPFWLIDTLCSFCQGLSFIFYIHDISSEQELPMDGWEYAGNKSTGSCSYPVTYMIL